VFQVKVVLNSRTVRADTSLGMNTEQVGSFRTRIADDGSLEVWARGWRLESQLYALVPMGLAFGFLLAPMSIAMRAGGAVVMLAATFFVFRMTKPGLWLTREAVSIVSVVRTQRFPWEQVAGFMGERSHDEARILMILDDARHVPLPGTLDPAELDPYGDEGQELSAADQLNQLKEQAVAGGLPKPAVPVIHVDPLSDHPTRKEQRAERKALRTALKSVKLTTEGTPEPTPVAFNPEPPSADATRKERRSDRKALRAALKAVRLTPEGTVEPEKLEEEPIRARRSGRRPNEPVPELVEVTIGDEGSIPAPVAKAAPKGPSSHYPTPVYIPQAEYAQMLRDQKAAEKAAIEAAAELRRLADLEELDELAAKEEFSDWTS
jgi:hypothetical protein